MTGVESRVGTPKVTVVGTTEAPSGRVDAVDDVAARYAKALFEFAEEHSTLPDVLTQVRALSDLMGRSAPFRIFLGDRRLDVRQAEKAVSAVLVAQGFGETLRRFVGVVARNRRLNRLADILSGVLALDARRRGEMVAQVRSAQPLTTTQRADLQARLAEAGYSKVSMVEQVEPELIGGLVVRIGARLFDTSIRGRLARIQNVMKGAA